jgi:hypothetical protein
MSLSAGRLDGLLESAVLRCLGLPGLSPGRDDLKRRELRCVSAGRARARASLARVCTYGPFVRVHLRLRWLLSVLVSPAWFVSRLARVCT